MVLMLPCLAVWTNTMTVQVAESGEKDLQTCICNERSVVWHAHDLIAGQMSE